MRDTVIKETDQLTGRKKGGYLSYVIVTFIAALLIAMLVFNGDASTNGMRYVLLLFFILSVLTFTFFLVKLLFHSQAKTANDEFRLSDIPKDQEDINKTH